MKEFLDFLLNKAKETAEEKVRTKEEVIQGMDEEFEKIGEVCDDNCMCITCCIKRTIIFEVENNADFSQSQVEDQEKYVYTKYELMRSVDEFERDLRELLKSREFKKAIQRYRDSMVRKRLYQVGQGTWKAPSKEETEDKPEENANEENEAKEEQK